MDTEESSRFSLKNRVNLFFKCLSEFLKRDKDETEEQQRRQKAGDKRGVKI